MRAYNHGSYTFYDVRYHCIDNKILIQRILAWKTAYRLQELLNICEY